MLIDEYQHVPELLDAIKAELNRDLRPGRYVLAGSTRYSILPQAGQVLTGRVDILDVLPSAQVEIDGSTGHLFVHQLLDGVDLPVVMGPSTTMRGTETLAGSPRAACRWRFAARPEGRDHDGSRITLIWSSIAT